MSTDGWTSKPTKLAALCKCGAQMRWAETKAGRPIPLNFDPNDEGNIVLEPRPGRSPLAIVVGPQGQASLELLDDFRTRYMPHHATCPNAADFR